MQLKAYNESQYFINYIECQLLYMWEKNLIKGNELRLIQKSLFLIVDIFFCVKQGLVESSDTGIKIVSHKAHIIWRNDKNIKEFMFKKNMLM